MRRERVIRPDTERRLGVRHGRGPLGRRNAALVAVAGLLVRFAPAEHRPKRWASVGGVLVVSTWIVTTLAFRWYVASIANFHTAVGQLTVFLILMVYVCASATVLIVGVQLDEFLREEASEQARGILDVVVGR